MGGNVDTWGPLLNGDFSGVDLNLGGVLSLSVAGNSNITLSAAQSPNMAYNFTGALTGNIEVIWPPGGGFYIINNATTGAFTLTAITSAVGAVGLVIPQGKTSLVYTDGTTFFPGAFPTGVAEFASGTSLVFPQAAAPTGWTQNVALNDQVLRVVSGAGGGIGGSWTITGNFGSTDEHVLVIGEIPVITPTGTASAPALESNDVSNIQLGGGITVNNPAAGGTQLPVITAPVITINSFGGGAGHDHTLENISSDGVWRPAFVNVLVASKN